MSELVFLLEERSMRELLQGLLPRLLPEGMPFRLVPHEGKTDLLLSLPRKLRAWRTPGVRFVVVCDKDAEDCRALKQKLARICVEAERPDTLVRIVCHHLEAWFLGDLHAVESAFGMPGIAARFERRRRYRQPDDLSNAFQELKKIIPAFQKVQGARAIAPYMDPGRNRSYSFKVFVHGLARLIAQASPD